MEAKLCLMPPNSPLRAEKNRGKKRPGGEGAVGMRAAKHHAPRDLLPLLPQPLRVAAAAGGLDVLLHEVQQRHGVGQPVGQAAVVLLVQLHLSKGGEPESAC